MRRWLLDTNVVSEPRRPKPDANVLAFLSTHSAEDFFVCDLTFSELRFGIAQLDESSRRDDLETWLRVSLRPFFADRVLPASEEVLFRWRVMLEAGRRTGHNHSQLDLLIAATAETHGLTVVTRDTRDFERAGVPVLNPWLASS